MDALSSVASEEIIWWQRQRRRRWRREEERALSLQDAQETQGDSAYYCVKLTLTQKPQVTRALRPVEVYQKLYGAKIRTEVMLRGYGLLNEEAEAERAGPREARVMTEEEVAQDEMRRLAETEERLQKNRKLRMSLWRTTAIEMFNAEPADMKAEVQAQMEEMNEACAAGVEEETNERTPEQYQQ